jgi:hypothetical protein
MQLCPDPADHREGKGSAAQTLTVNGGWTAVDGRYDPPGL